MTETEMRFTIAEWMGWKWYRLPTEWKGGRHYRCLFIPSVLEIHGLPRGFTPADMTEPICNEHYLEQEGMVPRYTSKLDSIAEAVKSLGSHLHENYLLALEDVVHLENEGYWYVVNATAIQRCEALCRTLFPKKWQAGKGDK